MNYLKLIKQNANIIDLKILNSTQKEYKDALYTEYENCIVIFFLCFIVLLSILLVEDKVAEFKTMFYPDFIRSEILFFYI